MSGLNVTVVRRAELIAEMRKNDPRDMRRIVRAYLAYLDRQGSLAQRLCSSGVPPCLNEQPAQGR